MRDVTFLIKTFERPALLKSLVRGIRRYYPSAPVVIADDGSPGSGNDALAADPLVEYHGLAYDGGISSGRNFALARVRTRYFVLLDDDFEFTRKTDIPKLVELLERHGLDIVGGSLRQSGFRRHIESHFTLEGERLVVFDRPRTRLARGLYRFDWVFNFFLARTASVRAIGGWDERLKLNEHLDFFLRAKKAALKVGYAPAVSVSHKPGGAAATARIRGGESYLPIVKRTHGFREIVYLKRARRDRVRNVLVHASDAARMKLSRLVRRASSAHRSEARIRPTAPSLPPVPFIVGVGRSGTTLLRMMLDAHPDLAIPAETYFLLPLLRRRAWPVRLSPAAFCRIVTGHRAWPDLHLSAEDVEREVRSLEPFTTADGVRLVYHLYARGQGKTRWGDKTPAYGRRLPEIHRLLPEARFVHIIRDGRDTALSLRGQWFAPTREIKGLARHWRKEVRAIRRGGAACPYYLEIRFEDLVREARTTLERICVFLELPFQTAMLDYHRGAEGRLRELGDQRLPDGRVIGRDSRLARLQRLGSPPDASRIGVWRTGLTLEEQAAFAAEAGDLLEELGYEL